MRSETARDAQALARGDEEQTLSYLRDGLGRGSWRTIKQNYTSWLRMEGWMQVNGTPLPSPKIKSKTIEKVDPESFDDFPDYDSIFPLTRATWTRYVQFLIKEDECGVTTPESARAGISWVSKRIGFPVSVNSPIAQGMIDSHFLEHGEATRKAIPLSLDVIKTLETAVCDETLPDPLRFTSFWIHFLYGL